MPKLLPALRMFAPELLGQAELFAQFYSATYPLKNHERRAVSGVGSHFRKALTLDALATKLKPNLDIDQAELDERGFTPALNATEFTAVIEAAILELYSSVDCAAKAIIAIYHKKVRGLKDSTSGLFENFEKITDNFPEQIKQALRSADWFEGLRFLRTELTHRQTGHCTLDHKTLNISYMHSGIIRNGRAFIIEDIFKWFRDNLESVNKFHGAVFHYLNSTLGSTPIPTVCGMVEGRVLMRNVDPSAPLNFDNGTCIAYQWFELPENPTCPFVENCGAYRRTRHPDTSDGKTIKPA